MGNHPLRNRRHPGLLGVVVILMTLCLTGTGIDQAQETDLALLRERALTHYDAGQFAEARNLLEQLDDRGVLEGPLLYRLYFTQGQADDDEARVTLRRALESLTEEFAAEIGLETGFYLCSAYGNVARLSARKRVAEETVAAYEDGSLGDIDRPVDQFRLGKLYADLERDEEARRWYEASLYGRAEEDKVTPAYVRFAARFLVDAARSSGDDEALARYLSALLADGSGTVADYDQLGVMHARQKNYGAARNAWNRALLLNPAQGNRPRYFTRLCITAELLAPLPETDASGKQWVTMNGAELEQAMTTQVAVVVEIKAATESDEPIDGDRRQELQARLDTARPLFVAAAMEYALQGNSLRETAFFGGFAQLVFRNSEWLVPYKKRKQQKRKATN